MSADGPTIHAIEDAKAAVARMKECLTLVDTKCSDTSNSNETTFVGDTKPSMEEATALSRQVAHFLDKSKHKVEKTQLKSIQMEFVATMKRLQETQRMYARKHEAVIEYGSDLLSLLLTPLVDLIQGGVASSDEFQAGKNILEKQLALAEEMGHLVHTVGQVNKVVHDQTKVIEHVKDDLEAVSIEIGAGIQAAEQAAYLRWEKMKKLALITFLVLLLLAGIITPILLTCIK